MSLRRINGEGCKTPKIAIVGDFPGIHEEIHGGVFSEPVYERELRAQLREAGIQWDECYRTYAFKQRPPGNELTELMTDKPKIGKKRGAVEVGKWWLHPQLVSDIEELKHELAALGDCVVLGLGNLPLFACTGNLGVGNWRGSQLRLDSGQRFVPTYDPSSILKNWALRAQVIHDLKKRVVAPWVERKYEFNITPTFDEVMAFIEQASEEPISADVETMDGHIVCLGLARGAEHALCIPFEYFDGRFWSEADQKEILFALYELTQQREIQWVGQNWNYDAQYFEEDFGWTKMADFDTYIAQSVLFPGSERGLGYLSSMWTAHHVYWKEDGKEWGKGKKDFNKEFRYNCMDVCRTWEIAQNQKNALASANLEAQFRERMDYSHTVYRMMRRGVIRDPQRTEKMLEEVCATIKTREEFVAEKAGAPVNFSSPKQVANLLYKKMGLTPYKGSSTDNDTLTKLIAKYPACKEVCDAILEARSLTSIKGTFLEAEPDPDGRLRSSWMATGTETFRLTSSKNAFHRGGPLQNVTDGKHTNSGRDLPNLRSTIVPREGYRIFNCDLQRADLQVVVWEAEDDELKAMLREGADIHAENAKAIFGLQNPPSEQQRHIAKKFVHLTNYGGKEHTCARGCHITVKDAERMQRRWFQAHPGIAAWHKRTEAALWGTRTVRNRFGYRRVYFDRVGGLLPEALAWVPQSTISLYISMIQMAWEQALGLRAPVFLQVHDSLVGEYLPCHEDEILRIMHRTSQIEIPYPDPLIIPLDLATSDSSWGEVEKRSWPI